MSGSCSDESGSLKDELKFRVDGGLSMAYSEDFVWELSEIVSIDYFFLFASDTEQI